MRSYALDSSIPALLVHIGNTYQSKESHLVKRGVPRGWGAGMAESGGSVGRNGLATTHLDSALCKYTIRPQFGKKIR
jgi:hypothetical protein